MSKIKLLVGNDRTELDISKDNQIVLKKALRNLQNYNKRKASFSKPFTVINNNKSSEVFKNLFNVNSLNTFDISNTAYAEIQLDSITQIKGFIKIEDISEQGYEVVVFTPVVNLVKKVGDKLIYGNDDSSDDIKFPAGTGQHIPTRDYIRSSWKDPIVGQDFIYPFVDHDNKIIEQRNKDVIYPVHPAVNVKTIFDKISLDNDFTINYSPVIENLLKEMYIPYNGSKDDIGDDTPIIEVPFRDNSRTYMGDVSTNPMDSTFGYNWYYGLDVYGGGESEGESFKVLPYPTGTVYNDNYARSIYDYLNLGDYKDDDGPPSPFLFKTLHTGNLKVSWLLQNGSRNIDKDNTDDDKKTKLGLRFKLPSGKLETKSIKLPYDELESGEWVTPTTPVKVSLKVANVPAGTEVYTYLEYYDDPNSDPLNNFGLISSNDNRMYISYTDWVFSGSKELNDILPRNYKQADFINDVLNTFNAFIIVDDVSPNILNVITYDEFYSSGDVKDLTTNVQIDTFKHYSQANSVKKNVEFTFKEDDDDVYLKDYDEQFNQAFGNKYITNPSNLTSGKDTIKLNYPSTLVRYDVLLRYGVQKLDIATIVESNIYKTEFEPRFLFAKQSPVLNYSLKWGLDIEYTGITDYQVYYLTNENDDLVLSHDNSITYEPVEFLKTTNSNKTIYNKFYKKDIEKRFKDNARLVEVDCILTPLEYSSIKFNDSIYIKNYGWFILEEIKKYSLNTNEAELILSKKLSTDDLIYPSEVDLEVINLLPESQENLSTAEISDTQTEIGGESLSIADINYWVKDESNNLSYNDGEVNVGNNLNVDGNIIATGGIMAYSDTGEIGSIWDDMPVATETTLGGVKVDSGSSNVYLDANNVLQVDIGEFIGDNLSIDGSLSAGIGDNRPILLDTTGGDVEITGNDAGWVTGLQFRGFNGDNLGGFRAFGNSSTLNYYYIGNNYTSPLIKITPDGDMTVDGNITANGTVTATNFILSSDVRLKENINKLNDNTDIISFNFKNDDEKRKRYGIIAQEIEKNNPELVYNNKEGYKQVAYIDYLLMKMAEKDKQIVELQQEIKFLKS